MPTQYPQMNRGRAWASDLMGTLTPGMEGAPYQQTQMADMWNMGMDPRQIQHQNLQMNQEQNRRANALQDRTFRQQDMQKTNVTKSYVDYLRKEMTGGNPNPMGISSWLSLDQSDRSKILSGGLNDPTTAIQNFDRLKKMRAAAGKPLTPEEESSIFQNFVRAQKLGKVGDVQGTVSPGGGFSPLGGGTQEGTAQVIREQDALSEYQKQVATETASLDSAFQSASVNEVPLLQQTLRDTRNLRDAIEAGQYNETGFIEGRLKKYNNQDTARMAAQSVRQALMNLQITRLTPVSNFEIQFVAQLFADIAKDPQANIGTLNEAIKVLENQLTLLDEKRQYWKQSGGTLKGYGIGDESWVTPAGPRTLIPGINEKDPQMQQQMQQQQQQGAPSYTRQRALDYMNNPTSR